ncbi:MAG TPA: hypothetical protein VGX68_18130 [Thermoanaerobaculia bacterium]|jgi:hypothetical protein|nr:hypothetical protein [Thermoanaerobaculia bacterium]
MRRDAIALSLLAAFAFGLLAGPHPCSAGHDAKTGGRSTSCHGTMKEGHGDSGRLSVSSHRAGCCETFCLHACHMTAVAEVEPLSFVIAPVAQAVVETSDPGLPPFAHAIDHVPLA